MREDYNEYKAIVDEHILDYIPNIDTLSKSLYDSMRYSLMAGGKRLRPVLMMAACEFCGGDSYEALPYACALEYIHTYSLIHDDLPSMDDDDMRRGQPSNHIVFGEAMATLAGDGLLNTAFEVMNKNMFMYFDDDDALRRRINACYAITKGAGVNGMIAGQVADIESESKEGSLEMLEFIHLNKTAALIHAAIEAGLYLGGADEETTANMRIYADNLGLAFQIADDILDVRGDAREMGKATGEDEKNNKLTYVSLNGLAAAEQKLHELTDNAVNAIAEYYDNAEFFRELVQKLEIRTK
jgi:geranylgeranyl diphosphate synthase type II